MRRLMPLLGGILLGMGIGIVIFFGFLQEDTKYEGRDLNQESKPFLVPSLDAPAPKFELDNLDGKSNQLEDFRGKPILLNFWATWCAPCRLEMPIIQRSYLNNAGELAVIAINNAEDPEDVQAFIDELDLTFEVLLDPEEEAQRLYQVRGYPTTFFIDRDGVIRAQHIGLMTEDQLDDFLQEFGVSK